VIGENRYWYHIWLAFVNILIHECTNNVPNLLYTSIRAILVDLTGRVVTSVVSRFLNMSRSILNDNISLISSSNDCACSTNCNASLLWRCFVQVRAERNHSILIMKSEFKVDMTMAQGYCFGTRRRSWGCRWELTARWRTQCPCGQTSLTGTHWTIWYGLWAGVLSSLFTVLR